MAKEASGGSHRLHGQAHGSEPSMEFPMVRTAGTFQIPANFHASREEWIEILLWEPDSSEENRFLGFPPSFLGLSRSQEQLENFPGEMQHITKGRHETSLFMWSVYLVLFALRIRNKRCFDWHWKCHPVSKKKVQICPCSAHPLSPAPFLAEGANALTVSYCDLCCQM